MKRIISLIALFSMVATGSAFAALAGSPLTVGNGQAIEGQKTGLTTVSLGKLSNNVSLYAIFTSTAFAAATKHLSGNRSFGTSFDDTKIYYLNTEVGKTVTQTGTQITTSDSTNWSGWVSL